MVKKKAAASTTTPPHSAAPSEPPQPRQIALRRRAQQARAPTQVIGQSRVAADGRGRGPQGSPWPQGPRPAPRGRARVPTGGAASILTQGPIRQPPGQPRQRRQRPESPIARAITSFMISLVPP